MDPNHTNVQRAIHQQNQGPQNDPDDLGTQLTAARYQIWMEKSRFARLEASYHALLAHRQACCATYQRHHEGAYQILRQLYGLVMNNPPAAQNEPTGLSETHWSHESFQASTAHPQAVAEESMKGKVLKVKKHQARLIHVGRHTNLRDLYEAASQKNPEWGQFNRHEGTAFEGDVGSVSAASSLDTQASTGSSPARQIRTIQSRRQLSDLKIRVP